MEKSCAAGQIESYVAIQQKGLQGWGNRLSNRLLGKKAGSLSGLEVLDLGGSSGEHFEYLEARNLARYSDCSRYVVLDPQSGMTSPGLAQRLSRTYGCEFIRGVAEETPFPDESFDLVIATCVLAHVRDPERALSEMFRILRAGGRAILVVPTDPGFANKLVKSLYTYPRMRSMGVANPGLSYARDHVNSIHNLKEFFVATFGDKSSRVFDWWPTGLPFPGPNLLVAMTGLKRTPDRM